MFFLPKTANVQICMCWLQLTSVPPVQPTHTDLCLFMAYVIAQHLRFPLQSIWTPLHVLPKQSCCWAILIFALPRKGWPVAFSQAAWDSKKRWNEAALQLDVFLNSTYRIYPGWDPNHDSSQTTSKGGPIMIAKQWHDCNAYVHWHLMLRYIFLHLKWPKPWCPWL